MACVAPKLVLEMSVDTHIAMFRRDKTFNTVFIIHPERTTPLTSLQTIASVLDKRVGT